MVITRCGTPLRIPSVQNWSNSHQTQTAMEMTLTRKALRLNDETRRYIVADYRTHIIGWTEPYTPKSKSLRFHPPDPGQPPSSLC